MSLFPLRGHVEGKIGVGNDVLSIHAKGHAVYGSLNDSLITESESRKRFADTAVPVLSMLLGTMLPKGAKEVPVWKNAKEGPMDRLLETFRNDKGLKVKVLEMKPDEIQENKPKQIQSSSDDDIIQRMGNYSTSMRTVMSNVSETRDLANILLKTSLPQSMWGRKGVMKVLSGLRSGMGDLDPCFDRLDVSSENTDRGSRYLMSALEHKKKSNEQSPEINKVAAKVIDSFLDIKKTASRMALALHGLFNIDGVFKKNTGYPTTWFFDTSVFYDFKYGYENLVSGMGRMAHMENTVIGPLFVWKVKSTGDKRCQTI